MKRMHALPLAAISCLCGLTGCGDVALNDASPMMVERPTPTALATPAALITRALPQKSYCNSEAAVSGENPDVVSGIANSAVTVPQESLPDDLANDPVVRSLSRLIGHVAIKGHHQARLAAHLSTSPNYETAKSNTAPGSVNILDFNAFARKMAKLAFDPGSLLNSADAEPSFARGLIEYYMAYYDGNFVDRFGNTIAKPTLDSTPAATQFGAHAIAGRRDTTISDDDVAGAVAVLIEYLADRIVHTPVWAHPDSDRTLVYYPGGTSDEPTALALGIVPKAADLAPDGSAEGITQTKAHAMRYLARSAASKASAIGGLAAGSFGGFGVSLGLFGKFSVGDNQTLQVVIKAGLAHVFERAVEQSSCELLARIPDPPADTLPAKNVSETRQRYDRVLKLIETMLRQA